MSFSKRTLLFKSLRHYRRSALAVLLGVAAACAVLTGALVVGDSLRGSLRQMTLDRLGKVDYALAGQRFFRESLADDIAAEASLQPVVEAVAPLIILPATAERRDDNSAVQSRAGRVTIYGVDDRAWSFTEHGDVAPPPDDAVILSSRLAAELGAAVGGNTTLVVELPSAIPRDALLGKRDQNLIEIPLTVSAILPEASGAGRLGLQPDQQLPLNAFVSLKTLQDRIGQANRPATRRNPIARSARVNALFVAQRTNAATVDANKPPPEIARHLTNALAAAGLLKLEDVDLRVVQNTRRCYLSIESERLILDDPTVDLVKQVDPAASPVFVYLANEMTAGKSPTAFSMYSTVAGVDPALFRSDAAAPFGPFVSAGGESPIVLGEGAIVTGGPGEIVLNDWLASDLQASVGDTVTMKYHLVGSRGELPTESRSFKVVGIVKLQGTPAQDPGLAPEVPGITTAKTFQDWEQPFEMEMGRITKRDDKYWPTYKATPKAFISLVAAQHLWKNRYGELTSLRSAVPEGMSIETYAAETSTRLLRELSPDAFGLTFQPVKHQGLLASAGSNDFGGLFIGFSNFLICSAVILVGLLFRLGVEQRADEFGLLQAVGWTERSARSNWVLEGLLVAIVGSVLGLAAAVGYASLMLYGLKTWWIGAIGTRFLELHVVPGTLIGGAVGTVVIAAVAIEWSLSGLGRVSIRSLLAKSLQPAGKCAVRGRRSLWVAVIALGLALSVASAGVFGLLPQTEAFGGFSWKVIAFFEAGIAGLIGGLAAVSALLSNDGGVAVRGSGYAGLSRLAVRSAARSRGRSLWTTSLMAVASFLVVTVAAAREDPSAEAPDKASGNGGFTLVAESSAPILYDFNTPAGRRELGLDQPESQALWAKIGAVIPFRVNPGENASCLNIYQTKQPTVLAASTEMRERGGFKFVDSREANPWTLLDAPLDADGCIPVFGDMNTLQYSLHVGPGSVLELTGDNNRKFKAKIAGMFDGSVFQGVLVMGEQHFLTVFPSRVGSQYFLIETTLEDRTAVSDYLESTLLGFDAEPVAQRLANFLAVQNTYLSTFLTLGGLGLLLGTVGLGIVMVRNVIERRHEFALLRAVGFDSGRIRWLVLSETAFLLVAGAGVGTLAALLAVAPHLASVGAIPPWRDIAVLLLGVVAVGLLAASAAVSRAVRTPVVSTLRGE